MSFGWRVLENVIDVVNESHVEHSVCFIQNDVFYPAQTDLSTLEEIKNATGSSDNHLCAAPQLHQLLSSMNAAHYKGDSNTHGFSKFGGHFFDLLSQLACGAENESLNADSFRIKFPHDRCSKGESFPGSCFCFSNEIQSLYCDGNGEFLDRSREFETQLEQLVLDFSGKREISELSLRLFFFYLLLIHNLLFGRVGIRFIKAREEIVTIRGGIVHRSIVRL